MLKEYKTISEVTGPLMLVKGVEGVGYDELGEIELPNGDIRHCRVLEINGNNVGEYRTRVGSAWRGGSS